MKTIIPFLLLFLLIVSCDKTPKEISKPLSTNTKAVSQADPSTLDLSKPESFQNTFLGTTQTTEEASESTGFGEVALLRKQLPFVINKHLSKVPLEQIQESYFCLDLLKKLDTSLIKNEYWVWVQAQELYLNNNQDTVNLVVYDFKPLESSNSRDIHFLFEPNELKIHWLDNYKLPVNCLYYPLDGNLTAICQMSMPGKSPYLENFNIIQHYRDNTSERMIFPKGFFHSDLPRKSVPKQAVSKQSAPKKSVSRQLPVSGKATIR